jgi:hypothetical protein
MSQRDACLKSLAASRPAIERKCVPQCLDEVEAFACSSRFERCASSVGDEDRDICDDLASACADKLGMKPSLDACRQRCVAAEEEQRCPTPR